MDDQGVKPARRKTADLEAIYTRNRKAIDHFGLDSHRHHFVNPDFAIGNHFSSKMWFVFLKKSLLQSYLMIRKSTGDAKGTFPRIFR